MQWHYESPSWASGSVGLHLSPFLLPSARQQLVLWDHRYGAIASRGVLAGIRCTYKRRDGQVELTWVVCYILLCTARSRLARFAGKIACSLQLSCKLPEQPVTWSDLDTWPLPTVTGHTPVRRGTSTSCVAVTVGRWRHLNETPGRRRPWLTC